MQKYYPIPGLSNYLISKDGQIYSKHKNRILKNHLGANGYYSVDIYEGTRKRMYVHRLLALTFIPNQEKKNCINHINGIKTDNSLDNLEWVSYQENIQHAHRTGLNRISEKNRKINSKNKSKAIIDLYTGIVYDSLKEACECLNMRYHPTALRISRKKEKRMMYI